MAASFSASILPCPRLWSTPTAVRFTLATTSRSSRRRSSRVSLIVQSSRTAPPQPPGFADHSLHSPSGRDLGSVDEADQDVSPNEEADQATIEKTADNQLLPKVLLLFVAFLWGSYAPSVRLLYSVPDPPDASVVMAVRGVIQAGTLLLVTCMLSPSSSPSPKPSSASPTSARVEEQAARSQQLKERGVVGEGEGDGSALWQQEQQLLMQRVMQQELRQQAQRLGNAKQAPPQKAQQQLAEQQQVDLAARQPQQGQRRVQQGDQGGEGGQWQQPDTLRGWFDAFVNLKSPPLWMAAVELGFYNYTATALQTFGLQLTSATRASFLIQATLVFTPLLSMLASYHPSKRVWAGCLVALGGTLLITADEVPGGAAAAAGINTAGVYLGGDAAVLLGALFYSLVVVRISAYARSLSPAQIATGKSVALGGFALCTLTLAAASLALQGRPVTELWEGYSDPFCWAVLLWSGVGPGALGSYLHVKGQREVAPAEAQVIFSSKPLWSAALAWVLLGGEELGPLSWVGGGILVVAGILASTGSTEPAPSSSSQKLRQG